MEELKKDKLESFFQSEQISDNIFLRVYIEGFIKKFRSYNDDEFFISISGIKNFISQNDIILNYLFEQLKLHNFTVYNQGNDRSINDIGVNYKNITKDLAYDFKFQIQNIPALAEHSSKTGIPLIGLIVIKIVAQIVSRTKILYKAFVLDLDDTLWFGTVSEIGIDGISKNMKTKNAVAFIQFMKFIKALGNELGVFIAICSKNDPEIVQHTIEELNDDVFPLKNEIDFIIANNNDKSENIKIIANELSVLTNSIIFIDDNKLVRDEVKNKLPEVFVPEWNNHDELITQLIVGCFFERCELSLSSRNRKKQYKIIHTKRIQSSKPELSIKVINDIEHIESIRLYTKSNQFKFSSYDGDFDVNSKSIYFEIFRENGENLGICSAVTYSFINNTLQILNWAISCRFFEIGVEEFILDYILNLDNRCNIFINYMDSGRNEKVKEIICKYSELFIIDKNKELIEMVATDVIKSKICNNTNIRKL